MNEPSTRFWEIFFEVYGALPRQGPGNRASAARALALCTGLPPVPSILDMGCGVGGQTLHLADLTRGPIVAVDSNAPGIERLRRTIADRGLSGRITPICADMSRLEFSEGSFDLIWSEGALYNIGIENALRICRRLLRPGGYLAFTDAVWRKTDPPPEVKAGFDADYPAMGRVPDVTASIGRAGLDLVGHFTLPDEAWWDDFYFPMERRIAELRSGHREDREALDILQTLAREPDIHRMYSAYYAYEFFVARRSD